MKIISDYYPHDVKIHYLDSKLESDPKLTPLFICPGLSETAEEYEELLKEIFPRRGIVLSFRGRGKSDSPVEGYDLDDHIRDIEVLVNHLSLDHFHLFAYSRGVSYALGYAYKHINKLSRIILQDYPPEHKEMSAAWADEYINDYLIPFNRLSNISEVAVKGIARDSKQFQFVDVLPASLLVLRGMLEGSLICEEDMKRYKELVNDCREIKFHHSGHNIRYVEREKLYKSIIEFLA